MEVLGAITTIIGLIDAIDRTYTAVEKIKGLPKAFETVKRHLPAVQKGLQEIHAKREENKSRVIDADKELEGILKNCEANVRVLQTIFDELQAKCNKFGESEWVWKDRCKDLYKSVLQGSKAKRVESLMAEIWGDVKHLALTEIIGLRSYVNYVVNDKIQELEKLEPSLEDRELEGTGLHATQNIASGGTGTQTNVEGDHNIVNSGQLTGEFAGSHFENFNYGDNHNHYHSNESPSADSRRIEFLYKLRGTDYDARLKTIQRPLDGTCQWFLQHPSFKAWLQNKEGLLLVSADAGCGKSVLAKCLIEKVLSEEDPTQTICYFFFKDDETEARSFTNASKALLHQLLKCKGALIHRPKHVVKQGEEEVTVPEETILDRCLKTLSIHVDRISDFRQVWSAFELVSKKPDVGPVSCVLDALDESDSSQRRYFLAKLRDHLHGDDTLPRAKFIITTRGYPQILNEFRGFATETIHLDGDSDEEKIQIQKEINIVMDYRLVELKTKVPGISDATLEIIRSGLTRRGAEQKTYLWMHLMFELFERQRSSNRARWRDIFENPPKTIASTYEKLLLGVDEESKVDVRTLLALIIAAVHPLTIAELSAAVSARTNTKLSGTFDMSDVPGEDEFKDWIRWQCGSFITIHESKAYLIHQTAREFLLADLAPGHGHWGHSIAEHEAHRYMAESCISWLSHDYFQTAEFFFEVEMYLQNRHQRRGFSRPFFSYAARYWVRHFKSCQRVLSFTEVQDIEPQFVAKYEGLFNVGDLEERVQFHRSRNTETRDMQRPELRLSEIKNRSPGRDNLFSKNASSVDSVDLRDVECLSDMEHPTSTTWSEKSTRISTSVEAKSNEIYSLSYVFKQQFLEAERGYRMLQEKSLQASLVFHERVQAWRSLVTYDDQIHACEAERYRVREISEPVLHYWDMARDGCLFDHKRLLAYALDHLFRAFDEADELTNCISEHEAFTLYSLVHVASQQGSNICLQYLYRKGFDINLRDTEGQTPLHEAARNGHEQTVALLLDFGASYTARDNYQRTPITSAMTTWKKKAVVENYLASIQKDRGRMRSLLYFAAIAETPDKESTLKAVELMKGHDVNKRTKLALIRGSPIVPLIAANPNLEFRYGNNNLTALHISVKKADRILNTLSLLLANVDLHASDEFGNTAFHVATWYGNINGLRALIEFGADVNCRGKSGDTALHITCRNGNAEVARFLLLKDADPEIRNVENQNVFELNEQLKLLNLEELIRERSGANTRRNFRDKIMKEYGDEKLADLFVGLVEGGYNGIPWVE